MAKNDPTAGNAGNDGNDGDAVAALDRGKRLLVGVAAILTLVAQIWSLIENQWKLGLITLLLIAVAAAIYTLSHRIPTRDARQAEILRSSMIALLIAIPLLSIVGLYSYSYLPRALESGTTIAVARFAGPPLPEPYKDCRPSDMLVRTLERVGQRFGDLRAFELPYSIDPDNRWAEQWAEAHGTFEAADVIVYGEYTLYSSNGGATPDEIVINPEVARIPDIPIGLKSAPLYSWEFAGSVAPIDALCSSDLPDASKAPPRFLDDARRLALAIVGLQALGKQDYQVGSDALAQAKLPKLPGSRSCDDSTNATSLCPGVLAFYLGTLDERLGDYSSAVNEFSYATTQLEGNAPFLNLGELYTRMSATSGVATYFNQAVNADPSSVAAFANRALFERDSLKPEQAAIDLDRALQLRPRNMFDELALSRAIYDRDEQGDPSCATRILGQVIDSRSFHQSTSVGVLVQYGVWLRSSRPSEGIAELHHALQIDPRDVEANYQLGLALEHSKSANDQAESSTYFGRAEYGPAYTDDDYLYRANAASELVNHETGQLKPIDYKLAIRAYGDSISRNQGAAYAYTGRAALEIKTDPKQAKEDLATAAGLRPDDAWIQSQYAQFLDHHGLAQQGKKFHQYAAIDKATRTLPGEEPAVGAACAYRWFDFQI
jgi:hypothetical protein